MAVIKCPLCKQYNDDTSTICSNCDFDIISEMKYNQLINSLSKNERQEFDEITDVQEKSFYLMCLTSYLLDKPLDYCDTTSDPNVPKCPKCGSTAITTGARGFNFTLGMIGASKTVNRCANCGHSWKPNGR